MFFQEIISLLGIIVGVSMPIVLWAYFFAYVDDKGLGKTGFISGFLAGCISVAPLLYMPQIADFFSTPYLDVFYLLEHISGIGSLLQLSVGLIGVTAVFFCISWCIGKYFSGVSYQIYLRNFCIVCLCIASISGLMFVLSLFDISPISQGEVSRILYSSSVFLVLYYIIVGLIEESSKHAYFLASGRSYLSDHNSALLYTIFVALGFSCVENILYIFSTLSNHSSSLGEVLRMYFFRSLFSVMLHVLAAAVIGHYFISAVLQYRSHKRIIAYIKTLFVGFIWGICLHALFDISLSLGMSFMVVIYFVGGYLYLTGLLYRK